jgi:hypothetical protein
MSSWLDSINGRLDEQIGNKDLEDRVLLRRAQLIQNQGTLFFDQLRKEAKLTVEALKARPDCQTLFFENVDAEAFRVSNSLGYPAITVDLQMTATGINFAYTKIVGANFNAERELGYLDFGLDASENLCVHHKGKPMVGEHAVLNLVFSPVFGLG